MERWDLCSIGKGKIVCVSESNIAPENGWLEDEILLLGRLPGRCELLVSGRVN